MTILLSGSIAYDNIMTYEGRFRDHIMLESAHAISLSFLLNRVERHMGGTAGNIAFTLGLLGYSPRLFASVGNDFGPYRTYATAEGIDCSAVEVHEELQTAFCNIMTDLEDSQLTGFYSGAMAKATEMSLAKYCDRFGKPQLLCLSPNAPAAMLAQAEEARLLDIPFIFDIGQQITAFDDAALASAIRGATVLIGNDYEMALLCKKTKHDMKSLQEQVVTLIITRGVHGSEILTGGKSYLFDAIAVESAVDPTGAGDAYRAGLIVGIVEEMPWAGVGRVAALAASYATRQYGTQQHRFSLGEFRDAFLTEYSEPCAL